MKRLIPLLIILMLLAAETAVFARFVTAGQAWVPPRWHDQLQYLGEAYGAYEHAPSGLADAARAAMSEPTAQGPLHRVYALAALRVLGPSRASVLAVNLAALLALQAALFAAARRVTGSASAALAGAALVGAFQFPWAGGPGSMADYRLDWMAACAFGVALSALVASRGMRSWAWALVAGLATGVAVLSRFILGAYFGIAGVLLAAWFLCGRERRGRWARLVLAAAAALAVAAPSLWQNRGAIHNYYWVSQLAGPDHALRGAHLGLLESAVWFAGRLTLRQVGVGAVVMGVGALFLLRRRAKGGRRDADPHVAEAWAPVAAFLAAPAIILFAHPVKDDQHLCVLLAPVAWGFVLLWRRFEPVAGPRAAVTLAAAAALVSVGVAADLAWVALPPAALQQEFRDVNGLGDYLAYRSELGWLHRPRIAVTWHLDLLQPAAFEVMGFERHGRRHAVEVTLPLGLGAPDPGLVTERITQSDFVLLVTRAPVRYPFDAAMRALQPQMKAWCEQHLRHVGDLEEPEFAVSLYERRDLPLAAGAALPDWDAVIRASADGSQAVPPLPPILLSPVRLLASTKGPLHYRPLAAYSPVVFTVSGLPEGLHFDRERSLITGTVAQPGEHTVRIAAANARGASETSLRIMAGEQAMTGTLVGPTTARAGQVVTLEFETLDVDGRLDYVEFTDLTTGTLLGRVAAVGDEKRTWVGRFPVTFGQAGRKVVQCRIVRFDPDRTPAYRYVDTAWTVEVGPGR